MSDAILFYGDPHGAWQPLLNAVAAQVPAAVVLLGDMDLDDSLDRELATILDAGVNVYWIAGNHDGDDTAWHDRLVHAGRGLDAGNLNGRIVEIAGWRVAGLGGVFRKKVWNPNVATAAVARTRADFKARISKQSRWRGDIPLRHQVSIFPEDFDALRTAADDGGPADILVCHEAPGNHDKGFPVIDELARDIGASWIVHGHHHRAYEDANANGVRVRSMGMAEPWRWPEGM